MTKPKTPKDKPTLDGSWICDRATLTDATEAGVRTKYAKWLQTNADDVRNVMPHRIKRERATPKPNGKAFSLVVEFEKKLTPEE